MTAAVGLSLADIAARRARVVALTRQGFTAAEIATTEGLTVRTVYRVRQELGASRERVNIPLTEDELRTATELLDDGCSYREAARTLGCAPRTIRAHFPNRGWPPGEGARLGAFNRWMRKNAGVRI